MWLFSKKAYRLYEFILTAFLLSIAVPGQAQEKVVVAVVSDGSSDRLDSRASCAP